MITAGAGGGASISQVAVSICLLPPEPEEPEELEEQLS